MLGLLFRPIPTSARCCPSRKLNGVAPPAVCGAAKPLARRSSLNPRSVGAASMATAEQPGVAAEAHAEDGGASFTTASPVLSIDPSQYPGQLDGKLQKLRSLFSGLCRQGESLPEIEVFESPRQHYRMRAEFTVWGTSNKANESGQPDVHYIMYDTASKVKPPPRIRMDSFPVGSELMNTLMKAVVAEVNKSPVLRERLFQANFHTTLKGESMVTLVYHKKLDDVWQEAAKALRAGLAKAVGPECATPHVIGRSRKQKVELEQSHVMEKLHVNGKDYVYKQVEGSFSQPNAAVCQHMLSWAQQVSSGVASKEHDLLELYCGNGNFTIPLAANFRRVVATEVAKSGVEAARANIEMNGVDNIFIARMSSEEFTEAWRTKAAKKRLEGLGSWEDLKLQTVLVDPPRAGLDEESCRLVATFDNIIYISCNPETLHHNLKTLLQTHKLVRFAAFDQFPYTHHLECGVFLQRR